MESVERALYGTETFTLSPLGSLFHGNNLGGRDAITEPYAESWLIFACLRVRANAVSMAPPRLWSSREDDAQELSVDTPLGSVLARPNPWMSGKRLWWLTQLFKDIDGEAVWFLGKKGPSGVQPIEPGGIPDDILPVRGSKLAIEEDAITRMPRAYSYDGPNGVRLAWPAHAALPFPDPDPRDWRRGFGIVDAVSRIASIEFVLERYDEALARRSGVPSVAFSAEGIVTETQAKQNQARIEERFGNLDSAGKPVVLGNGLKPIQLGLSPRDMEHREGRIWRRDAIMAAFGVTKPLLGITDDVNRANAREARAAFWEGTALGLLREMEDDFQERFLRTRKGPERAYAFSFNTSAIPELREAAMDAGLARTQSLVLMGVPFKTAVKIAGLEIDEELLDEIEDDEPEPDPAPVPPTQPPTEPPTVEDPEPEQRSLASSRDEREDKRQEYEAEAAKHRAKAERIVRARFRDFTLAFRRNLRGLAEQQRAAAPSKTRATQLEIEAEILALMPLVADFAPGMADQLAPVFQALYTDSARKIAEELGKAAPILSASNPQAAAFLAAKRINLTEGILSTLSTEITNTLAAALVDPNGFAVQTLTEAVRDRLGELEDQVQVMLDRIPERAQLIARTETTAVQSAALVAESKAQGVKRMVWLSALGPGTRETHAAMDGLIREVGQSFRDDITLRWPGDPMAPVGEIANCACSLSPVIEGLPE